MRKIKIVLKYVLGIFFVVGGLNHFISPAFYLKIMPPYLPWHLFLVYLSGLFEVACGALLLVRRFERLAAWGLIAILVAVSPANIHMATHAELYTDIPPTILWLRLPLQLVLIAWAYLYTREGDGRR
ncbi:MAG: DoxX family membrane protein [Pyrinomonadaceae bacterium]